MSEKNLLLINMSTFPKKGLEENYYTVKKTHDENNRSTDSSECYFCGVSQLEAGTKYFLQKLQGEGKKLDKIFIVESPETQDELMEISEVSKYLNNEEGEDYAFLECEEDSSKTNAVRFYKERICQYIQGREKPNGDSKDPDLIDKVNNSYEYGLTFLFNSDKKIKDLFCDISIADIQGEDEQRALFERVYELCKKIQDFAEDESDVKLYLYMQGGKRHEAFIINAAVNMLSIRDIKVEESVTVDFNDGKKVKDIVDATLDDRIFEMVSGMDQFITTGRGDTLLSFCDNSKGLVYLEPERNMIEAIRRISTAISICNVKSFNSAISNFNVELKKYNEITMTNPLFKTFVKDLKDDYDKFQLLEETESPTINQVSWCLDKKLYQQALTLLESHVPDDIVKNKIIYYGDENRLATLLKTLMHKNKDNENENKKEKAILNPEDRFRGNGGVKAEYVDYIWIHKVLFYESSVKNTMKIDREASRWTLFIKLPKGWNHTTNIEEKDRENNQSIKSLLKKYQDICKIRNAINHSDDMVFLDGELRKINSGLVEKRINKFVDCYKKMIRDQVQVNLSLQIYEPDSESMDS